MPGDLDQSFRDAFTPATVWENVGMAVTAGAEGAIALNRTFETQYGLATIEVEHGKIVAPLDSTARDFFEPPAQAVAAARG